MEKIINSLSEAEELQVAGWKVKSISGNPKIYVMEKGEEPKPKEPKKEKSL